MRYFGPWKTCRHDNEEKKIIWLNISWHYQKKPFKLWSQRWRTTMCNSQASSVPTHPVGKESWTEGHEIIWREAEEKHFFFSSQYKTKAVLNLSKTKWIQQRRNRSEQSRKALTFPRKLCTFFLRDQLPQHPSVSWNGQIHLVPHCNTTATYTMHKASWQASIQSHQQ